MRSFLIVLIVLGMAVGFDLLRPDPAQAQASVHTGTHFSATGWRPDGKTTLTTTLESDEQWLGTSGLYVGKRIAPGLRLQRELGSGAAMEVYVVPYTFHTDSPLQNGLILSPDFAGEGGTLAVSKKGSLSLKFRF